MHFRFEWTQKGACKREAAGMCDIELTMPTHESFFFVVQSCEALSEVGMRPGRQNRRLVPAFSFRLEIDEPRSETVIPLIFC